MVYIIFGIIKDEKGDFIFYVMIYVEEMGIGVIINDVGIYWVVLGLGSYIFVF